MPSYLCRNRTVLNHLRISQIAKTKHGIAQNPNAVVFILLFLIVFISKLNVLNVPYYWDETGWVSGAYWLSETNLIRVIPGLHPAGLFLFHPPILHFSLAILFKLFGQSIWLSHLWIATISFLGVYFTFLLGRHLYGTRIGIFSALFLFFSPMYFAQSAMFLGDLPVAAFGAGTVYFALRGKYLAYLLCGSCLAFAKEPAIAILVSVLAYLYWKEWRNENREIVLRQVLKFSLPLLLLSGFFVLQRFTTGYFSHLDAMAQRKILSPEMQIAEFVTISKWLFYHQYRIVFSICIAWNLILYKESRGRSEILLFLFLVILCGFSYCFMQFLPRYILPVLPYFYVVGCWSFLNLLKMKKLQVICGLAMVLLFLFSLSSGVSYGTSEWNMKYLDAVKVRQSICEYLEKEHSNATILAPWPHRIELIHPYLGYVNTPLKVIPFFGHWKAFDQADLLFFSEVPRNGNHELMKRYAHQKKLTLLKRVGYGPFLAEVYRNKPP